MEVMKESGEAGSILLIEDDAELCVLMREFFTARGFRVQFAHDGRTGLAQALSEAFDLVVLDVMLPILDGFDVLHQIRKRSHVPVIMLTARTAQPDRIKGLDGGADDYLPKPFGPEELLARIRAILRRVGKAELRTDVVTVGRLRLDSNRRMLWQEGKVIVLTSIEFDIIEILMRAAGRVVSRDEIATILHQRPSTPFERSLDVHISHLRKKIELENGSYIQTVRGLGYVLAPGSSEIA
jgi:two-component system, OmpR family, response regulator CpxR